MMKKVLLIVSVALITATNVLAQNQDDDDLGILNHGSVALGIGTTGISADLILPFSPYVAVRGGADILPFKYSSDYDIHYRNGVAQAVLPNEIKLEGKLSICTGHLLFDVFPSKQGSFHLTAGAYLGGGKVAEAYNKEDGALAAVTAYNKMVPNSQKAGYTLGDYFLTPDENGNVNANVKVSTIRPYVGIGFGRPFPTKSRVAYNLDLGVQYWGKPKVTCQGQELTDENLNGDDGGIVRYISMASIWPVLNFHVVVRLF
ncbi:MAG: hypothetical protein IKX65_05175 [Prevotella sp.]|nr:hypothetical protein [Prevotella sp.]